MSETRRLTLPAYFADVAENMRRETEKLRRDFATHAPSAGDNREDVVRDFLDGYLPNAFGLSTGLIFSGSGEFSNQADLLVVDQLYNAPLHPTKPNKIWFVEAVYSLIEVKTHLHPSEIADAVQKCRRFKSLPRRYSDTPSPPRIGDSLFVLWGFNAPSPETLKANLLSAFEGIPANELPDFIIVPDQIVATCGNYRELATLGQPGSMYRQQLLQSAGGDMNKLLRSSLEVLELGNYSLLAWLVWFTSWLKAAGQRSAPLEAYLPQDMQYGRLV